MSPDAICLMLWRYCQHNDKVSCFGLPLKQQRRCEEEEEEETSGELNGEAQHAAHICMWQKKKRIKKETMTGSKTTVANE